SARVEVSGTFPLARGITGLVGWPAVLANDSDVAGLAETLFGAGKGLSPIFYITIGSGIGGGLIINGEIYRGCGRGAAEIGHTKIKDASFGQFPSEEVLEDRVSGWGIEKAAQAAVQSGQGQESLLLRLVDGNHRRITPEQVAETAH